MQVTGTELKNLQALLTKKGRRRQGRFLAEGIRLLEESLRHSFRPDEVFYAPADLSARGRELAARFRAARVPCRELSVRQLSKLADTPAPQGIVGVFTIPRIDPAELCARRHRTILVCENVADPGNLGTLLRSALAFGFRLVVTVGTTAEPFAPKVVRSSAGAVFGVRIAAADCDTLARLVASEGITLLAAGRGGTQTLSESLRPDPAARYALAVGSEAEGLSDRMRALAACTVRVAHAPEVESLNAAVAGSILMKGIYDSLS